MKRWSKGGNGKQKKLETRSQDIRVKNGEKREPWMEWDGEI